MNIDYSKCSSEIIKTPLSEKGFSINYVYRVFGNRAFDNDVNFYQEGECVRNLPYMELWVPTTSKNIYNVYTTFNNTNYFQTTGAGNIIIDNENVIINDRRRWMMDGIYQILDNLPPNTPLTIQARFKNYPKIGCPLKWTAQKNLITGSNPYTIAKIFRRTVWVYEPVKPVYILVNFTNNIPSIYVMQSLNLQKDISLSVNNVDYIGRFLNLPKDWLWASIILERDTYLKVVSDGEALVVEDSLGNTYEYLDPKYAPWLYEQYYYINKNI